MNALRRLRAVPRRIRRVAALLAAAAASPFLLTKAMHELGNRPLLAAYDSAVFGLLFAFVVVLIGTFAVAAAVRASEDAEPRGDAGSGGGGVFPGTVADGQHRGE